MWRLVSKYTTTGLACDGQAARATFGDSWRDDPRYEVLHCGVDTGLFRDRGGNRQHPDAFGFPSDALVLRTCRPLRRTEGLPVTLIEAQAAGLPCIIAHNISDKVDCVGPLITRVPLERGPKEWARVILENVLAGPRLARSEALGTIENSEYNLLRDVRRLEQHYQALATT